MSLLTDRYQGVAVDIARLTISTFPSPPADTLFQVLVGILRHNVTQLLDGPPKRQSKAAVREQSVIILSREGGQELTIPSPTSQTRPPTLPAALNLLPSLPSPSSDVSSPRLAPLPRLPSGRLPQGQALVRQGRQHDRARKGRAAQPLDGPERDGRHDGGHEEAGRHDGAQLCYHGLGGFSCWPS